MASHGELCDTGVLGAIHLQATFSGAIHERRGTLERRLHTRHGRLVCDLLSLRVLRIATITLAASRTSATLHARSDLYDVL